MAGDRAALEKAHAEFQKVNEAALRDQARGFTEARRYRLSFNDTPKVESLLKRTKRLERRERAMCRLEHPAYNYQNHKALRSDVAALEDILAERRADEIGRDAAAQAARYGCEVMA